MTSNKDQKVKWYCPECGKRLKIDDKICPNCGVKLSWEDEKERPIAGIVVAGILGTIGIVWTLLALYNILYQEPSGARRELIDLFPSLQIVGLFGSSVGMVGNITLLVGALLSFLMHPKGNMVVKATAWSMILITILICISSKLVITTGSSNWPDLDNRLKTSIIYGLSGSIIGGLVQWGIILFLFRKAK